MGTCVKSFQEALEEIREPKLESPELERHLASIRAKISELERQLEELERKDADGLASARKMAEMRSRLLKERERQRFMATKLTMALKSAEERDAKARKAYERARREAALSYVERVLEELGERARAFGDTYESLLTMARELGLERLAGPATSVVIAEIAKRHGGEARDSLDLEARRLALWSGISQPDPEGELDGILGLFRRG